MSLYTEWTNRIKTEASYAWLTDGQRQAFVDVLDGWDAAPFVCLCGAPGSGKSFIARLLAQQEGYVYAQDLDEAPEGSRNVVLDGPDYTRGLRQIAAHRHLNRVVITSRQRPEDPMPCATIALTERDVRQFLSNLTRNSILGAARASVEGTDLGRILRNEAVERGKRNAT